jgi:Flp pilus assembly protein TadD
MRRVSKPIYLILIAVCLLSWVAIGASAITLVVKSMPSTLHDLIDALNAAAPLLRCTAVPLLVLGGALLTLAYQLWSAIQDGQTRPSPWLAVGLLFVPVFNVYWFFRVVYGFSVQFNRYIERNFLSVQKLPQGLFLTFNVFCLTTCIPFVGLFAGPVACILLFIVVAKSCNGVNALAAAGSREIAPNSAVGLGPAGGAARRSGHATSVSAAILGGMGIVLAGAAAYVAVQSSRRPDLRPSGPIIQVPGEVLYRSPGKGTAGTVSKGRVSVQQVATVQRDLTDRPHDPKVLNDAACVFGAIGQLDAGALLLEEAVKLAPADPVINYNYARELYQQGKVTEAIRYADTAVKLQPEFDEARLLRAAAAVGQSDYATAEQQILKLVHQGLAIALVAHGAIDLSKGKVREAVADFEGALKLVPNDPTALYDSGVASQMRNDLPSAAAFYRQAIGSDPELAEAHSNLGTILAIDGQLQAAFEEFRQASFLKPADSSFRRRVLAMSAMISQPAQAGPGQVNTGALQSTLPAGYVPLPPAERARVGLAGAGAGSITVTNSSQYLLDIAFTGPTGASGLIPANLSKTFLLPEGQYRVVGNCPTNREIRPFYGSEYYRSTERSFLQLYVTHERN